MEALDLNFVRSQFPAFSVPDLKGLSFFENAGGSYPTGAVVSRLARFYHSRKVQPYANYSASRLGGQEMDEAHERLSLLLNVAKETLHFGPSTSQNTYVLSQAFRKLSSTRRVIIVTNQDHEANTGSWRKLEADGFLIREWKVNKDTGTLSKSDLEVLLDDKVLLVTFPHCSNILGEINPVTEICKLVKESGAFSCVDGVSYAPHGFSDLGLLGADIYLFSSYKTYGPHLGIMYICDELNRLLPNQGHYFNENKSTKKFTPAGPDHAQIAAAAGIVDYFETLYRHQFRKNSELSNIALKVSQLQRRHEEELLSRLLNYLKDRKGIRILGPITPDSRVPTVSLDIGDRSKEVAAKLAKDGIMADAGDFYAVRLLDALGVDLNYGVLRLSFVHYTSGEDVEKLIESLDKNL